MPGWLRPRMIWTSLRMLARCCERGGRGRRRRAGRMAHEEVGVGVGQKRRSGTTGMTALASSRSRGSSPARGGNGTNLGGPRLLLDRLADVLAVRLLPTGGSGPSVQHEEGEHGRGNDDPRGREESREGGREQDTGEERQERRGGDKRRGRERERGRRPSVRNRRGGGSEVVVDDGARAVLLRDPAHALVAHAP